MTGKDPTSAPLTSRDNTSPLLASFVADVRGLPEVQTVKRS